MKEEKEDHRALFEEAASESLNELVVNAKSQDELPVVEIEDNITSQALDILDPNLTDWDRLAVAMEGKLATKAANIMATMPDREFIRVYPKMLEFFKPKITRVEQNPGDAIDRTVTVQIVQRNDNGEINVITLNEKNE